MSLSHDDVEKIAHLARIALDEADLPRYTEDLTQILSLVEQMNAVDTQNIPPMAHPLEAVARLREDVVTETNQRENFQQVAPQIEEGLYLVPQVIE
jgi:aspartyl-tRNA(Asn)/glutamyl-tRNA(Gln) amidotransferase subunit C